MAGSFRDTEEQAILDYYFGAVALSLPAAWHFALFITAPGETGSPTEVSGSNYSRISTTRNQTNFPAATQVTGAGQISNGTVIEFPVASGSWGDVVGVGLMDAASGGTMRAYADIASQTIGANQTIRFAVGALTFRLT